MYILRFLSGFLASTVAGILTLPVLLIGLPFWLVAILHKFTNYSIWFSQRVIKKTIRLIKPIPKTWDSMDSLMRYEPVVGWKPIPNLNTYSKDKRGNKYKVTTDASGWRDVTHNHTDHADIYVFGDSFAFGFGVNDQDFFANAISHPRIQTIGANGYNLVQEYLLMKEYSSSIVSKTVIWFIYHGNDLYENLMPNMSHYRMPFVRERNGTGSWEIVSNHVNSTPWTINKERNYRGKLAEICSDTTLSRRAFQACGYLIEQGKKLCDEANATLIVFSIPDIYQLDKKRISKLAGMSADKATFSAIRPDKELKAICEKRAVPFYSTRYYLNTEDHFLDKDAHWNREGHRRIAELIRDVYEKHQDST